MDALRAELPEESGVRVIETCVWEGAEEAKFAVIVPVPSIDAVVDDDEPLEKVMEPVEELQLEKV